MRQCSLFATSSMCLDVISTRIENTEGLLLEGGVLISKDHVSLVFTEHSNDEAVLWRRQIGCRRLLNSLKSPVGQSFLTSGDDRNYFFLVLDSAFWYLCTHMEQRSCHPEKSHLPALQSLQCTFIFLSIFLKSSWT